MNWVPDDVTVGTPSFDKFLLEHETNVNKINEEFEKSQKKIDRLITRSKAKFPYKSINELICDFKASFNEDISETTMKLSKSLMFIKMIICESKLGSWVLDVFAKNKPTLKNEIPKIDFRGHTALFFIAQCYAAVDCDPRFIKWISNVVVTDHWEGKQNIPVEFNSMEWCFVGHKRKAFGKDSQMSWLLFQHNKTLHIFSEGSQTIKFSNPRFLIKDDVLKVGALSFILSMDQISLLEQYIANPVQSFVTSAFFPPPPYAAFPDILLDAISEALVAKDTLLLRAFCQISAIKPTDCTGFIHDIVNVFSHHSEMVRLLRTLVYLDFSDEALREETVLRKNTYLTATCVYFCELYGQVYFRKVIRPIIEKVGEAGAINYKKPNEEESQKIYELIMFAIDTILSKADYVPPQLQYLATMMTTATVARFNTRKAAYNTVSGFFVLRFITRLFVSPTLYDKDYKVPGDARRSFVAFAQIIQEAFAQKFSREVITVSDEQYNTIMARYKDLYNFIYSIGQIEPATITFRQADENEYKESIRNIAVLFAENREEIVKFCLEIKNSNTEPSELIVSDAILKCFKTQ